MTDFSFCPSSVSEEWQFNTSRDLSEYTRSASMKCGFQPTDGAPEQFVL